MPYQPHPFYVHRPIHFPDGNNMAFVSLVKKNVFKELNMSIHRGSTSIITDISGNVPSKEDSVEVTFQLPRESIEHECIVCYDGLSFPSDGRLGVDFLNKFRPTLDF
ncbi:hypothetical protein JTB14_020596 [Gonioctena quinquepunctata]|nr:hypothetical protein JTB14_020596 [Gonioctena quinquepunctata]